MISELIPKVAQIESQSWTSKVTPKLSNLDSKIEYQIRSQTCQNCITKSRQRKYLVQYDSTPQPVLSLPPVRPHESMEREALV